MSVFIFYHKIENLSMKIFTISEFECIIGISNIFYNQKGLQNESSSSSFR